MPSKKRSAKLLSHSINNRLKCPTCGEPKGQKAKLCWKCYNKSRHPTEYFYDRTGRKYDWCPTCGTIKTFGCQHCQKCAFVRTHVKVSTRVFYRKGRPLRWIGLTRNYKVAVDAHRYKELSSFNWFTLLTNRRLVYAVRWERRNGKKTLISMHQQVVGESKNFVDHIDHDTLNNMRYNLRRASPTQSIWNRRRSKRNTSGYIGVSWYAARHYWTSSIVVNGKSRWLGTYHDKIKAAKAFDAAAKKYRGEFAHLNFP